MKYLSDKEILRWNDRLQNSPYRVYPFDNTQSSHPYICFNQIMASQMNLNQLKPCDDPRIAFDFTFSISENRIDDFFNLLNRLMREKTSTKTFYENKTSDIQLPFDYQIDKEGVEKHSILSRSYVRYAYHFVDKLSTIMVYISYIEDAMCFFEKMWGYDETGKEICSLKFPVGSVVSKKNNKSKDYLIIEYDYIKSYGEYYINYKACEIIDTSVIIKYGEVEKFTDEDLCFSRNNRIDGILN